MIYKTRIGKANVWVTDNRADYTKKLESIDPCIFAKPQTIEDALPPDVWRFLKKTFPPVADRRGSMATASFIHTTINRYRHGYTYWNLPSGLLITRQYKPVIGLNHYFVAIEFQPKNTRKP